MIHQPSLPTSLILEVFACTNPGIRSAAVLPTLAILAGKGQATMNEVRNVLKISRETINHALLTLERAGFVSVERGSNGFKGKKQNIYRIKL